VPKATDESGCITTPRAHMGDIHSLSSWVLYDIFNQVSPFTMVRSILLV